MNADRWALLCIAPMVALVIFLAVVGVIVGPGWARVASLPFIGLGGAMAIFWIQLWREA